MILLKAESLYRLGRFDDALRVLNPLFCGKPKSRN